MHNLNPISSIHSIVQTAVAALERYGSDGVAISLLEVAQRIMIDASFDEAHGELGPLVYTLADGLPAAPRIAHAVDDSLALASVVADGAELVRTPAEALAIQVR